MSLWIAWAAFQGIVVPMMFRDDFTRAESTLLLLLADMGIAFGIAVFAILHAVEKGRK